MPTAYALNRTMHEQGVNSSDLASLDVYKKQLDHFTKFIPTWVKLAVAIALGLGTMTYAQGASAEIVGNGYHPVSIALAGGLDWLLRTFL